MRARRIEQKSDSSVQPGFGRAWSQTCRMLVFAIVTGGTKSLDMVRSMEASESRPGEALEAAKRQWQAGDFAEAAAAFEALCQTNPTESDAWLALAYLRAYENRAAEGAILFRKGVELRPDYRGESIVRMTPSYVQLETVRTCNAACVMCPLEDSHVQRRALSDDLFFRIADQLIAMRPRPRVAMHGLNEPLMDKKLARRLAYLKNGGIETVSVVSNASLMTEKMAEALIDAGLSDISFSIESIDQKTFEAIRVGLKLSDVLDGVAAFVGVRERLSAPVPVKIMCVYSEKTRDQYKDFRAYWQSQLKRPDDKIILEPIHSYGHFDLCNEDDVGPCFQPFNTMQIRADGLVSLCTIDVDTEYEVGDVRKQSLLDIFNGDQFRLARYKHLTGNRDSIDICKRCDAPESLTKTFSDSLVGAPPQLNGKYFVRASRT